VVGAADPLLRYRGAVSLQPRDGLIAPWRVPWREADLFLPTGGVGRAAMTSGVRVTFRTDSTWVGFSCTATAPPELKGPPEHCNADLVCDGRLAATVDLDTGGALASYTVRGLPAGAKTVELWLPCYSQFRLAEIRLAPGARLERDDSEAPRWVHYGSSESHARGAASPATAWTARVTHAAGLDLTNVAMGAGCHLQPLFGTLMRDLPAELLSCVVGANNYGLASLNAHSFRPNLIGFVRLIRERHPHTPLVVMSPIHAPWREDSDRTGTLTLRGFRAEAAQAVDALRRHGDAHLHYLDGLEVFGPEQSRWFLETDGVEPLHPDPAGHAVMAERFLAALTRLGVLPAPARADP
jgi:hypothetical protein